MMCITYVGRSGGDYFDLFHVLSEDDERPVLEILVSPDNVIWIAGVTGLSVPRETDGRVHRHRDAQLEEHGIDTEYVCLGSVAAFVRPRIAELMARVYVPTTSQRRSTQ